MSSITVRTPSRDSILHKMDALRKDTSTAIVYLWVDSLPPAAYSELWDDTRHLKIHLDTTGPAPKLSVDDVVHLLHWNSAIPKTVKNILVQSEDLQFVTANAYTVADILEAVHGSRGGE